LSLNIGPEHQLWTPIIEIVVHLRRNYFAKLVTFPSYIDFQHFSLSSLSSGFLLTTN